MLHALRFAVRSTRQTPGLALVAILSIAIGIGATTAVFSVIHAVLIDPYPYRGADRMVHLQDLVDAHVFSEFQKLDVFDGVIATDLYNMTLSAGDLPEAVTAARVSPNAFEFLGVPPLLGRAFGAAGSPEGQEPERVVVLSYAFWQSHLGGDPDAVGQALNLDRERYLVAGVAPPRFQWSGADVFLPARLSFYQQPSLEIDARLRPGATRERAEADTLAVMRRVYPKMPPTARTRFRSLNDRLRSDVRSTLVLVLAAVFVLLAVGCANVSILLLARATARQHELALRAALGASRSRLAGHLLTESVVLTAVGGGCGVLLAFGVLAALAHFVPAGTFPPETDIRVNLPVLLFTLVATTTTGVLAGLAPMLRFSRPPLHDALQSLANRATAPRGARRAQRLLVASQVALTMALLAAAGTAIRSLVALYHTELGFDPRNHLTVTVPTLEGAYPTYESRKAFFEAVRAQVALVPAVESATYGSFSAPFFGSGQPVDFFDTPRDPRPRVLTQFTTPDYFSSYRIPIVRGRVWSEIENARPANVVVINQAMASQFWPGGDALGRKIRMPGLRPSQFIRTAPASADWLEVVGIVGNTRNRGLHDPPAPAAYIPYTLFIGDNLALIVRTRTDPLQLVRPVRERIHAVAAGQPIGPARTSVRTGEDTLRSTGWEKDEFVSSLFTSFGGLALALATIGLYCAVSYATALRSREFGVRLALGARKADVIWLVVVPAFKTTAAGVVAGLGLTIVSGRLLAHWAIAPTSDTRVLPAIVVILLVAAAAAAVIPARRAAAADPIATLRNE